MRWLRRRRHDAEPPPSPEALQRIEEARAARESSEQRLADIFDQWPEVKEAARASRRIRERNGFERIFNEVMRGGA